MDLRFFDFEVFPNWWCCVFGDLPNDTTLSNIDERIKDTFFHISSDDGNARDDLMRALCKNGYTDLKKCLLGYNIKNYDLQIANTIYQGFTPQQVKMVNDMIINPNLQYLDKEHARLYSFTKRRLSGLAYQDLFDSSDGTLKEKEATLGLSVLESSVPFDKEDLTAEDKEDILVYCKHDVYAAMIWYLTIVKPFIESKLAVSRTFAVPEEDAYRCTNAQLVAKVLDAHRTEFGDEERKDVSLPLKIKEYVNNNLPSKLIEYVCNNTSLFSINLFENIVTYADGGIHSIYDTKPKKKGDDVLFVESDDEWTLLNVDASSYYPSIMINLNTLSRAIRNPERFKFVFEDRVRIKHKKDKTKADDDLQLAYKLILNTTYGASGCEFLDLSDAYQRTRTCRFGQLYLTALANKMYKTINGLKVIQTNTDGVLVYVRRKDVCLVEKCMKEWTELSGIGMDTDEVSKIWQRDVNNYLLVKANGKIKRKGSWLRDDYIKPGHIKIAPLDVYVCGKAAIGWLVNGENPIRAILSNTTIDDFVVTCKKGPTFRGVVQRLNDGTEIPLFKCNRVIATKDENVGMIYKYKMNKGQLSYTKMSDVPEHCLLVNDDLHKYDFNKLRKQIDYMYYIERLEDKLNYTFKELKGYSLTITNKFDIKY